MTEFIDRAELPEATEFIRRKLTAFDLSKLDKLTLKASLRSNPLSWRVKKPVRFAKGSREFKSQFEVTGSVIGEKYHVVHPTKKSRVAIPIIAARELQPDTPSLSAFLNTRAEMLVFAAAAGTYHYLRRTRQVPGVAANWMARRYAYGWAAEFSPWVSTNVNEGVFVTCFGVNVPKHLTDGQSTSTFYFDYVVSQAECSKVDVAAMIEQEEQSAFHSIDLTFGDCDTGIVDALKTSEDPKSAWLILADWLEERGDSRAAWIRSHKLGHYSSVKQRLLDDGHVEYVRSLFE